MAPFIMSTRRDELGVDPFSVVPDATATIVAAAIFLTLAWISCAMRFYTRVRLVKSFGADDSAMAITLVLFSAYCGSIISLCALVNHKSGLTLPGLELAANRLAAVEAFYVSSMTVFKIALSLFFLRIMIQPWQRALVIGVTATTTAYSIAYFFIAVFQCGYTRDALVEIDRRLRGQCIPFVAILDLAYAYAAVCSFTDILFSVLPLFILKDTMMKQREKVIVCLILALGGLGCVASLVRIKYVPELQSQSIDFYAKAPPITIASISEVGIGIVASNLATLRKFVAWFNGEVSSISRSFTSQRGARSAKVTTASVHSQPPRFADLKQGATFSAHDSSEIELVDRE